jgi:signal transduction histidine kinase
MSFARSLFLNRISGQMAVLILASLLAIHAVITTGLFLSHRFEGARVLDDTPGEIAALARLVAAAPPGTERAQLVTKITHALPHIDLRIVAAMPPGETLAVGDPRLWHLERRLGPGFQVVLLPAARSSGGAAALAIRMPDGDVLTAHLPPHLEPPRLAGPLSFTLMFVVVSVTLLALWATRALRTPLSGFAKAAEGFSLDSDVAALPERGPEEIRAVARAFNRMRERIRKLVDDRTRLLAAMGHDLRTPITRLRLRSEFISDEELRRQMLRDLDQMKAMTDGVLSFLRDGQTREATTAIDIASVLQTVCDQYADMGYAVAYEGPAHLTLTARPDDLQRAVANLVDNAVRHGATIVLRLDTTAEAAAIAVEDDGPGIPDDRKDAMLEAFVRGEESRTMDDRTGFGLGLSIARAIAEAHGGTLTLHDRVPHGLVVRIMLPVAGFPLPPAYAATRAH